MNRRQRSLDSRSAPTPRLLAAASARWILLLMLGACPMVAAASESATGEPGGDRLPPAVSPGGDGEAGGWVCSYLPDALASLRAGGLELIWSSDLVRPEMQIRIVPDAETPEGVLQQILAPFGLTTRPAPGSGALLVVRGDGAPASVSVPRSSSAARASETEGVLPVWLDRSDVPISWQFPVPRGVEPWLPETSRYLIIELGEITVPGTYSDWESAAFELKNLVLEAGSKAEGVRVALAGDRATIEPLVRHGLAPYVHAYVHHGDPWRPAADATSRSWYRSSVSRDALLEDLLEAAERGDETVIFEGLELDSWQHAFLSSIQAMPGADLHVQPRVAGIDQERVRFFLEPESGDHYLAIRAREDRAAEQVRFSLPAIEKAEGLFPDGLQPEMESLADRHILNIDGRYPFYLIRLEAWSRHADHRDVDVSSTRIIDPWEEVVANQIFQERELEKFQSLDVWEYLSSTPQYAGGDQIVWEHRIIQRKGRLAEYHHLGYSRNGVRYPENKLLKGRLFRNEALLQLRPLEVELDETYSYRYLGAVEIDGRPTHRIAFEPLRRGSVEDGSFVKGEVWIDQENHSHLRIRTYQEGLDGQLVFQERVTDYEWIHSGGECFWDWRNRRGTYVVSSLGRQYPVGTETRRERFRYNRPDIEQVVADSHASDLMIHVESPPEGHRWLVKADGERRLGDSEYEPYPATGMHTHDPETPQAVEVAADPGPSSERVLADVHAYSTRSSFSVGGYGSSGGGDMDIFPGIVISDSDFLNRGWQAQAGAFKEYGIASVAFPNVLDKGWILTAFLDLPWESDAIRGSDLRPDGTVASTTVDTFEPSLTLGLAIPVRKRFTFNANYSLRQLDFTRTGTTSDDVVVPEDTVEHGVDLAVSYHHPRWTAEVGLELGQRADDSRWGFEGNRRLSGSYSIFRLGLSSFHKVGDDRSLGAGIAYYKGTDLDRFSRLRSGRARAGVVGFSNNIGFDEGAFANVTYGTSMFRRLPINLRLDGSLQQVYDSPEGWEERIGVSFRFLINGPLRTDIWPSIRYSLYSSVNGEEGDVSYGLVIRRRY